MINSAANPCDDYDFKCTCGTELGFENVRTVILPDMVKVKCHKCDIEWEIKLNKKEKKVKI